MEWLAVIGVAAVGVALVVVLVMNHNRVKTLLEQMQSIVVDEVRAARSHITTALSSVQGAASTAGQTVVFDVEAIARRIEEKAFDEFRASLDNSSGILTHLQERIEHLEANAQYMENRVLAADAAAHAEQIAAHNLEQYGATAKMDADDKMRNALDFVKTHKPDANLIKFRQLIEAVLGTAKIAAAQPSA